MLPTLFLLADTFIPMEGAGEQAQPVQEELHGIAETLAFSPAGFDWHTDWWKALLIAIGGLLCLLLALRVSMLIMKLVGVMLCILVGITGGFLGRQLLTGQIEEMLPESLGNCAPWFAAILGFMVFYLIAAFLLYLIRKPAQVAVDEKK